VVYFLILNAFLQKTIAFYPGLIIFSTGSCFKSLNSFHHSYLFATRHALMTGRWDHNNVKPLLTSPRKLILSFTPSFAYYRIPSCAYNTSNRGSHRLPFFKNNDTKIKPKTKPHGFGSYPNPFFIDKSIDFNTIY
jgi:hypothetical protein